MDIPYTILHGVQRCWELDKAAPQIFEDSLFRGLLRKILKTASKAVPWGTRTLRHSAVWLSAVQTCRYL